MIGVARAHPKKEANDRRMNNGTRPDGLMPRGQIAKLFGVTHQRLSQIENKALAKLRQAFVRQGFTPDDAGWALQQLGCRRKPESVPLSHKDVADMLAAADRVLTQGNAPARKKRRPYTPKPRCPQQEARIAGIVESVLRGGGGAKACARAVRSAGYGIDNSRLRGLCDQVRAAIEGAPTGNLA